MLHALAVLLLIHPRILLVFFTAVACCWPVVSSLPTTAPRAFPAELPPGRQSPACIIAGGSSFPSPGLFTCSCWMSEGFCRPVSPACLRLPERQPCPRVYLLVAHSGVICKLHERALHHLLQVGGEDVKQDTSQDGTRDKQITQQGQCHRQPRGSFPASSCTGISYSIFTLPM